MSGTTFLRRILAITFLNFFISGGLTLAIPLLLLERNVDLVEIGLVISILPLVFLLVRLVLALLADLRGWNRLYLLLNWPMSLLATLLYFIANSTPMFLLGKIAEAIKESSYWAVNRTAIFSLSPKNEAKESTKNDAVLFLSIAIGSAATGLGISYFGFQITLFGLLVAGGIIGFPAALLWKMRKSGEYKTRADRISKMIDPRSYGTGFWSVSVAMLFFSLTFYPLLHLLFPIFMAQKLGYDYLTIGVAFMFYNLIASAVIFGTLKIPFSLKRVVLQIFIASSAFSLMAYLNSAFIGLFLVLAVAEGLGMGLFETIIAKATKDKSSVSVDIGLLHIPMRFAEFVSLLYAGLIAQSIGYTPIFFSCGAFFVIFSVLAFKICKT